MNHNLLGEEKPKYLKGKLGDLNESCRKLKPQAILFVLLELGCL